MQSYKKRVDATCPGRSVIITNDKRIFKDHEWLDDKETRAKNYRARYMGIDKNNPNRLDVSIYPRILTPIDQGFKFWPKVDCESEIFFEKKCEAKAKRKPNFFLRSEVGSQ